MNKKVFIAAVVIIVLLVPAVLISFNFARVTGNQLLDNIVSIMSRLSNGIWASLILFSLTLIFSMPIGLLVTFARRSRFKVVEMITKFYISVMRGTPLMLQLIVVYFAPYYLFKIPLSSDYRFYAAVIGFSLNYAAYFAEIYRSGIEAVSKGHYEAAKVLGYSRRQTFMKIVFPQMVRHVLPPVTNEIITLVKDTSLAYAIAYVEMFTLAKQIAAAQSSILALFVAGIFYYFFNLLVAFVMGKIEKKMNYYTK
ncbi:MAG: amino acid ABC transporter permease [Ruminococcus sp.]|nr:amino acid ABC transporter permease [Ruminococcus sp.]